MQYTARVWAALGTRGPSFSKQHFKSTRQELKIDEANRLEAECQTTELAIAIIIVINNQITRYPLELVTQGRTLQGSLGHRGVCSAPHSPTRVLADRVDSVPHLHFQLAFREATALWNQRVRWVSPGLRFLLALRCSASATILGIPRPTLR